MTTTVKLVAIGNSKGVRLPAGIIRRYQLLDKIQLEEVADGILLRPASDQKLSLAESFAAMAKDRKEQVEIRSWENCNGDGLEDDEFAGWPR